MNHRERARQIMQSAYDRDHWNGQKIQDALTEALAEVERETLERAAKELQSHADDMLNESETAEHFGNFIRALKMGELDAKGD